MRLEPIEKPRNPLTLLAYRMIARQFGKVATPLKVFYARKPGLLPLLMLINRIADRGISLDPQLRLLIFDYVDTQNGCTFCDDYRLAMAVQKRIGVEKFAALSEFRTSDLFSSRERAALTYAEEVGRNRDVSDETFENLQKHFSEVEIVEITWLIAIETYFNLTKVPLQIESDGLRELAEERIERKVLAGVS